jgi:uncharacterized protein (DUF1330 family)
LKRYRFEVVFGLGLLAGFMAFRRWQNPGLRGKLTAAEIDRYMAALQTLDAPADVKPQFLIRLRRWMESDDGASFYNLNVMRFRPRLQRGQSDPEFNGTPEASNAHYEATVSPMLLKIGAYPTFAGNVSEPNLVGYGDDVDNWSRIAVVRYPSRRALLDLLTDPVYQRAERYKVMALDQLLLIPVNGQIVLPDATWLAGAASVIAFLTAALLRAVGR